MEKVDANSCIYFFLKPDVTEVFHIDHLHPKSQFLKKKLHEFEWLNNKQELLAFYDNEMHWNTIPNLHLLNDSQNISKKDRPLKEWIDDSNVNLSAESLLVKGIDLDFKAFLIFSENVEKC